MQCIPLYISSVVPVGVFDRLYVQCSLKEMELLKMSYFSFLLFLCAYSLCLEYDN